MGWPRQSFGERPVSSTSSIERLSGSRSDKRRVTSPPVLPHPDNCSLTIHSMAKRIAHGCRGHRRLRDPCSIESSYVNEHSIVSARSVLLAFLREYWDWQAECSKVYSQSSLSNISDEELSRADLRLRQVRLRIFEMYCEAGSQSRIFRDEGMAFKPLAHGVCFEEIVGVLEQKDAIVFEAYRRQEKVWSRYKLIDTPAGWKISDRMWYRVTPEGKWRATFLS